MPLFHGRCWLLAIVSPEDGNASQRRCPGFRAESDGDLYGFGVIPVRQDQMRWKPSQIVSHNKREQPKPVDDCTHFRLNQV